MLMDVIPLDATLVKGSHGTRPASQDDWPVLLTGVAPLPDVMGATDVARVISRAVRGGQVA